MFPVQLMYLSASVHSTLMKGQLIICQHWEGLRFIIQLLQTAGNMDLHVSKTTIEFSITLICMKMLMETIWNFALAEAVPGNLFPHSLVQVVNR